MGLSPKVKDTRLGDLKFPLPLVLPVPADDRMYEKRGGFQLGPGAVSAVNDRTRERPSASVK